MLSSMERRSDDRGHRRGIPPIGCVRWEYAVLDEINFNAGVHLRPKMTL